MAYRGYTVRLRKQVHQSIGLQHDQLEVSRVAQILYFNLFFIDFFCKVVEPPVDLLGEMMLPKSR